MTEVYAAVYPGSSASGKPIYEAAEKVDLQHSYCIGWAIDNAMVFNELGAGDYTFLIRVKEMVTDPGRNVCYDHTANLVVQNFRVE